MSTRSLRPTWAESPRELGAKLSRSDYNQACEEKATFQKFLSNFVFKESTVLLLPGGDPNASYRDGYLGFAFHAITTSMPSANSIKLAEFVWEKVPRIWLQEYSLLCSWWISMCIISRCVKDSGMYNKSPKRNAVGQISYRSKVTTKEAFEPVSLMLVGPFGIFIIPSKGNNV
jgi:hypothetical protein